MQSKDKDSIRSSCERRSPSVPELSDEQKAHITGVFYERIEDQLKRMQARTGTLNCDFAGPEYRDWILYFRSNRFGFEIVDFEYDTNTRSFGNWS